MRQSSRSTSASRRFVPRKTPTQERARVTFDAIVDAAVRILEREGYRALTTNHVADVAGISIGSLYEYFRGKESIVAEVVRRLLQQVLQEVTEGLFAALATGDLHRGVRGWMRVIFDAIETRQALIRTLAYEVPFLREIDDVQRFPEDVLSIVHGALPFVHRTPFTSSAASLYVMSVMVHAAVLEGVIDRPRHFSRADIEDTLAHMLIALISHGASTPR